MLIWILFVGSICFNGAHELVREIVEEAMEKLEKREAETGCEAVPFYLKLIHSGTFVQMPHSNYH